MHDFETVCQFAKDNKITENDLVREKLLEFAATFDLTWPTQRLPLDQLILSIRRGIQNSQIIRQQNIRQDIPREENTTQDVNQSEEQSEIAQNTSQTVSREENINTSQDINVARFAPLNNTEMTGRGDEIQKGNTDKDRETCQDCGKTFARRQDLNRHRQSIHQNKIHKCSICAKEFSTSSNLTRHKKACSGNKTKGYQCMDCHITCNTQAGLRQHVSTKHRQTQKPIKCHNCGNFFQDRRVLNTHKNTECSKQ